MSAERLPAVLTLLKITYVCVCLPRAVVIKSKRAWIELSLTGNPPHTYFIMTSLVKALNAPLYWARAFHIHLKESFWMVYVTLLSLSELQLASLFTCTCTRIDYAGKIVMTAFQTLLSRFIIKTNLFVCEFKDVRSSLQAL